MRARVALWMIWIAIICFGFNTNMLAVGETANARVTILVASNNGTDFDLDNDAYRDELIKLFAFTSYRQVQSQLVELTQGGGSEVILPEGYVLSLTYQGKEADNTLVKGLITKDSVQIIDTILSVKKEGVVFLGGPQVSDGSLVIVLEMNF